MYRRVHGGSRGRIGGVRLVHRGCAGVIRGCGGWFRGDSGETQRAGVGPEAGSDRSVKGRRLRGGPAQGLLNKLECGDKLVSSLDETFIRPPGSGPPRRGAPRPPLCSTRVTTPQNRTTPPLGPLPVSSSYTRHPTRETPDTEENVWSGLDSGRLPTRHLGGLALVWDVDLGHLRCKNPFPRNVCAGSVPDPGPPWQVYPEARV